MSNKHYIGLDLTGFEDKGEARPVSRVTLYVDDEHVITAGDDTGLELTGDCPHATQAMADAILERVKGYKYKMYSATSANLDPAAELGDGVTAGGIYSVISRISDGDDGYPDLDAPGEAEPEDEFPTEGPVTRAFNKKISDTRATIEKTADSIKLEVSTTYATKDALGDTEERLSSSITQTADSISQTVSKKVGYDEIISSINQTAEKVTINASKISLEGLVTVNKTFKIDESGYLQCTGGTIGGFTIGTSSLYNGMTSLTSTANGVYVGTNGIGLGGGKFKVTSAGELTAIKGKIGNWDITEYGLHNRFEEAGTPYGDITSDITINAPKTGGDRFLYLSFSGSSAGAGGKPSTNTFYVTAQGELYADSAYIKGEIHATSGDFSGKITSREGSIGGFTIGQSALYNGLSSLSGTTNGVYLGTDGIALGGGKFKVTSAGALTSTSGTFQSVTISGSTFSGSLSNATGSISGVTGSYNGSINSGGTFSGTHSGGSLSGTGGSFYGGHYSNIISSCNLGGTSLTTGSGDAYFRTNGTNIAMIYGSASALMSNGVTYVAAQSDGGYCSGKFRTRGDFMCEGKKDRLIRTDHFGPRLLDAFETPLPTFSDYGEAVLDKNGVCYITIDPIFAETVDVDFRPTVFLTPYGEGALYVGSVEHDIVTVRGTPGLRFSWETRYAQANAYVQRLQVMDFDAPDLSNEHNFDGEAAVQLEHSTTNMSASAQDYLTGYAARAVDYGEEGYEYYTEFERSLEVA